MRLGGSVATVAILAGLAGAAPLAFAQGGGEIQTIWRCVDSSGKTHVTNVKDETAGKDCKVIQTQRVNVVPPQAPIPKSAAKSPAGFPKESSGERANARDRQKATLESELASEEALLAKAKAELAEQESIRLGDEKNYAKVLERLQKYKDNVELHEKNVGELRKELGKLK
ncbi:MAG: DUF4124 domain-containing protein [Proteobacteria bacterium]|nr:DUF4124 domain-containing protein [Pseudomonadota bacterium]